MPMKECSQTVCSHLPRCIVAVAAPLRLPNPCFLAVPACDKGLSAPSQERGTSAAAPELFSYMAKA